MVAEVSLWSHGSIAFWPVVRQKGMAEKGCLCQGRQEEEMTRETGRGYMGSPCVACMKLSSVEPLCSMYEALYR